MSLFEYFAGVERFFATSNDRVIQRVTSDFLQWATSETSNKRILQRVTSDSLQRATSATSNKKILKGNKRVFPTSSVCNV